MTKLEWSDNLLTGHHDIDNQHKTFFLKAQKLRVACSLGKGAAHLRDALFFLIGYAHRHFESEEKLMREIDYPHLQSHLDAHLAFSAKLQPLLDALDGPDDPAQLAEQATDLAVAWFVSHIRAVDMPLIEALGRPAPRAPRR